MEGLPKTGSAAGEGPLRLEESLPGRYSSIRTCSWASPRTVRQPSFSGRRPPTARGWSSTPCFTRTKLWSRRSTRRTR